MTSRHPLLLTVPVLLSCIALVGCTSKQQHEGGAIRVTSTESTCAVSADSAPSGTVTFSVTNKADAVTEFYLLGEDGKRVGEVENIGPGLTRDLAVQVDAGTYFTVCKPGMSGDGVGRAEFTVTK